MKQIILLIIAALAGMSVETAQASSPSSDKLDRTLRKEISYPEFAKSGQIHGMVMVEFEVLTDGSIKVNQMNTSDDKLGKYVRAELEKIKVQNINEVGKHYVKFKFRFMEV